MDPISDTQPLTKSNGKLSSDRVQSHMRPPITTVIRPKHPRRYKLLPRDKLQIPFLYNHTNQSSRIWKRDHYMKHMPLIAIDPDEEEVEEFNETMFTKVSNKNLHELLIRDQPVYGQSPKANHDADNDDDDWELCLAPPTQTPKRLCCPCPCTIS